MKTHVSVPVAVTVRPLASNRLGDYDATIHHDQSGQLLGMVWHDQGEWRVTIDQQPRPGIKKRFKARRAAIDYVVIGAISTLIGKELTRAQGVHSSGIP